MLIGFIFHTPELRMKRKRWPFASQKTVFYITAYRHPTAERPQAGMSFGYFYKATSRPRHAAFIVSVARYARSVHYSIAVMASVSVKRSTASRPPTLNETCIYPVSSAL